MGNQKKRQPGLYAAEWQVISFQHTHTHTHQLFISSLLARPQRRPLPTIDIEQVSPLTESSWPNTMHAEQDIALAKVLVTLYANRERETGTGRGTTCKQLLVEALIGN